MSRLLPEIDRPEDYKRPLAQEWPYGQERSMAYALLHRYSNLKGFLERMPPQPGASTLRQLAAQGWALPAPTARPR